MKRNWVALAAIAVVYVLFRFHSLPTPLDRDEGIQNEPNIYIYQRNVDTRH